MPVDPEEVFVPAKPANKENNAYIDRSEYTDRIRSALKSNSLPIIYGGYGVGKTTVAKNSFELDPVIFNVEDDTTLQSFKNDLSRRLGLFETASLQEKEKQIRERNIGAEAGIADGKPSAKVSIGQKDGAESEVDVTYSQMSSMSNDQFIETCNQHGVNLLIDELHTSADSFKKELSRFLKAYTNHGPKNFKICIAGTRDDVNDLVDHDAGIDRAIIEIQIKGLKISESTEILRSGFGKLGIGIPVDVLNIGAGKSGGSAHVTQFLGEFVSKYCKSNNKHIVTADMFDMALEEYARNRMARHIRSIRAACETTGKKRYRKQILRAMADSDTDYVSMEDLTRKISEYLEERTPATNISGPLRQLKDDERYKKIIKDVQAGQSGAMSNTSAFRDQSMKYAIKVYLELEKINTDIITQI